MDLVGFTLIVDDTVHPDGTTSMEQLGGGGPQTLWGFQLACGGAARVGLAAGVGDDIPQSCKDWLSGTIGCDLSGLLPTDGLPTPRAWQVMEWDGRRTQVWRSPECDGLYAQLRPKFEQLPGGYRAAANYHLGIHAAHPPMKLLRSLRDAAHAHGGLLSVETYTSCDAPLLPDRTAELSQLLSLVDVFSPNEGEARSILLGTEPPPGASQEEREAAALELAQGLVDLGAATVLLRRGPEGVLAAHGPTGAAVWVPAVPGTRVRDVVGCGNACCGAFLAAYSPKSAVNTGSNNNIADRLAGAAAWGCAAGSVMAEHEGVPRPAVADLRADALRRRGEVLQRARPARLPRVTRGVAAAAAAAGARRRWGPAGVRAVASAGRTGQSAATGGLRRVL